MTTNRLLVIEKLVFAIPPNMPEVSGEPTIDDAFIALLAYRSSSDAVLMNQSNDFLHSIVELPDDCSPEDPMSLTKENLLKWLSDSKHVLAGIAHTLVYDEDLKSFRNAYSDKNLTTFLERKEAYLKSLEGQHMDQTDLESVGDGVTSIPISQGGVGGRYERPESIIIPPDTESTTGGSDDDG